jgi:rhodanese-related sulfurtransferase/DNA-binding transcriptional ArsR family regulator
LRILVALVPMGERAFKLELYGQFARVGKALASGHRLEMLDLLSQGPRTVDSLGKELDLSIANTSSHLNVLKEARLVESRKDGLFVHYKLADDSVVTLLAQLRVVAERRIAEIDRIVASYLGDRDGLEPIGFDELRARLRAKDVILLDVRPQSEFETGHIDGAHSIPHDELAKRLREIPLGKAVVAYCRGPYCVFADDAVKLLRSRRRKAQRLVGGFPEWKAAGLPIKQRAPDRSAGKPTALAVSSRKRNRP